MKVSIAKLILNNWFVLLGSLVWLVGITCWLEYLPWSALAIAFAAAILTTVIITSRPGPIEVHKHLVEACLTLQTTLDGKLRPSLEEAEKDLASFQKLALQADLSERISKVLIPRLALAVKQVKELTREVMLWEATLADALQLVEASRIRLISLAMERTNRALARAHIEACLRLDIASASAVKPS